MKLDWLNRGDNTGKTEKEWSGVTFINGQLYRVGYTIIPTTKFEFDKDKQPTPQEVQAIRKEHKKVFDEYVPKISKVYGAPYVERSFASERGVAKWDTKDANIVLETVGNRFSSGLVIMITNNIVQDHVSMENAGSGDPDSRYRVYK